jgi:hypothetical protein
MELVEMIVWVAVGFAPDDDSSCECVSNQES